MSPRPAPDLTARRDRVLCHTRRIAEAEGWDAVTIRRLATELGVTQPVLYTVFGKRQDIVDAVALRGFATALDAGDAAAAFVMDAGLDHARSRRRHERVGRRLARPRDDERRLPRGPRRRPALDGTRTAAARPLLALCARPRARRPAVGPRRAAHRE